MVLIWLVGQDDKGSRILVNKDPVRVSCLADVASAFQQRGWALTGTTGYVLKEGDIRAGVDVSACVEGTNGLHPPQG
jgi:hypothetical protein